MGNKAPQRCPNGPGTSRAPVFFEPDVLEIVDFKSKIGIVRAFWLRKELLNEKTPLVLIHGWGCGAGYWHKLNRFLARNRAILFIDLPGFGESERMDIGKNPAETWPETLEEVITSLIPRDFFIVAHSLGGWLSTLMSLKDGMRDKIKGLILLDPAGYNTREMKGKGCWENFFDTFLGWFSDINGDIGEYGLIQCLPQWLEYKVMKANHGGWDEFFEEDLINYICEINSISPPSGDYAFMKLWKPRSFIPLKSMSDLVKEKAKNYPKNVIFIWGTNTYLESVKGDMLQEFFENDKNLDSKIESTYVQDGGHNFPASHPEDTAELINKFITKVEENKVED